MADPGSDLLEGYGHYLTASGLAPRSVKRYSEIAALWLGHCAREGIIATKATAAHMMHWLADAARIRSQATVRSYVIGLRRFFGYLVDTGRARKNPAKGLKLPRIIDADINPYSEGELVALFEACRDHRDRAIFFLLLGGGLRISEVAGVRREHINFEEGTIRIFGKGRKWRAIAPGREAMNALRYAMLQHERLGAVEGIDYRIKLWGREAGLTTRVHAHRFRYTFSVAFCENGGGIDELQSILGHSSITMSMRYSKAGREKRALNAQRLYNPADRLAAV